MLFDFERFVTAAKLAYRRCESNVFSFNDVLHVFQYYFESYELVFGAAHPMISIDQITQIIEKMPFIDDSGDVILTPEDYQVIIDQHFITKYRNCDYNINHFFSGRIREMRCFETLFI